MKCAELKIQYAADREKVVTAIANAGYFVTVEERGEFNKKEYWVVVESRDKKNA